MIRRSNLTHTRLGVCILALSLIAGCQSQPVDDAEVAPSQRIGQAHQLYLKAQQSEKAGKTDEAIELYQQSLAENASLPYVWNNLGVLLLKQQRHLEAVEAFQRAGDLSPMDPRPLENIGIAYHERGWDRKALDYFNRALEVEPRSLPALRGAIKASKRLGIADEATLDRVRTAMMQDRDPAWVHVYQREQFRIEYQIQQAKAKPQGDAESTAVPLDPSSPELTMPSGEPAPLPGG